MFNEAVLTEEKFKMDQSIEDLNKTIDNLIKKGDKKALDTLTKDLDKILQGYYKSLKEADGGYGDLGSSPTPVIGVVTPNKEKESNLKRFIKEFGKNS